MLKLPGNLKVALRPPGIQLEWGASHPDAAYCHTTKILPIFKGAHAPI